MSQIAEKNQFVPLIDTQVMDSIEQLLLKVDKQSTLQIDRIKFRQDENNTLHVYDQINQIIMKTNNIYNLCIQQLRQELLNNKMESHSMQYQKIFNGLNTQLTQVIQAQVQVIKYHKTQDKKQLQIQKMIKLKNENKAFIPIHQNAFTQKKQEDIPLEQKLINELQKVENQRQEKDKILLDTKLKIMKTENEIFKQQSDMSENIENIDQCLQLRGRSNTQRYSGAEGVYGKVQKNLRDTSKSTQYNFLGLASFEDLNEDDDNLSPFSKQKKKEEKDKKKKELATQLIKRLQNGEIDQVLCEFKLEFEHAIKKERYSYDQLYASYEKIQSMLASIMETIKHCKCGIISKKDLLEMNKQFDMIVQTQKILDQTNSKKMSQSLKMNQKQLQSQQPSSALNGGLNIKDFGGGNRWSMMGGKEEMVQIANGIMRDKNGQTFQVDKNGQLVKVNKKIIQGQNGELIVQDVSDKGSKKKSKNGNFNSSFCSSTSEEEIIIDGQPSGIFQRGKSKKAAKAEQILKQAGLSQKLDENGEPMLDASGKPVYVDKSGKEIVIALDVDGKPLIDESGQLTLQDESGNKIIAITGKDGKIIMQPVVQVEGFSVKLDQSGKPVLNSQGQPIFVDSQGNQLVVKLDQNGKPLVDDSGKPVYEDQNGNLVKPEISNGKMVIKKDLLGVQGFMQKLDEKGNPVLNENGQAVFIDSSGNQIQVKVDKSGKPVLDEKGKPIMLDNKGNIIKQQLDKNGKPMMDASGKPVFVDAKGKKVALPKAVDSIPQSQKIFSSMVEEEIEQKFIVKDGKKIEIFKNEKGEFYQKDENGNVVVLDQNEVKNIVTEKKKVQVQQNFVIDKNGKKQVVKMDEKGQPYYVGENGKKVELPKQQGKSNQKEVFTDDSGKQYVIDKATGKKQQVMINEKGQQYIINESGKPEVINQPVFEVYVPEVIKDKDGNQFIINENGEKQKVVVNQFGEQCVVDKNGYVVPISQKFAHKDNPLSTMQQQIFTNENGDQFIVDKSGQQLLIKTDDKGNKYFESKDGVKQLIPDSVFEQQKEQPQIFMNEKGEMYVKDADGKQKKVVVDDFGQQFIVNEDGTKVAVDPSKNQKAMNFQVHTNENGDKFIVNKKGEKMIVKKDKSGNEYVVGSDGKKVIINQQLNDVLPKQKAEKKLVKNEVFKDEKGNAFIYDKKTGQKVQVQMSKDGKPFTVGENGQIIMVNSSDQPSVETDEKGNEFVTVGGKKQKIQINKNGQKFFINEDGKQQVIQEPEYESSSSSESDDDDEEEEIPEFVNDSGNCKYCGKPFQLQKKMGKYKGEVMIDENGERYILDEHGNKLYIQVDANGNMFYIDANGNKIEVSKKARIVMKYMNHLIKKNQRQITVDQNQKSYDTVYRKFATDDRELIEKMSQMDQESQEKLLFSSPDFIVILEQADEALMNEQFPIQNIYELLRNIGANFKMSYEEFMAKFKIYRKMHQKCGNSCDHLEVWFKQMFVKNQIARIGKQYLKMLKQKINPQIVSDLAQKFEQVVSFKVRKSMILQKNESNKELIESTKDQIDISQETIQQERKDENIDIDNYNKD